MNNKNIVFHIGNVRKPQIKEVQFPTLDNFGNVMLYKGYETQRITKCT